MPAPGTRGKRAGKIVTVAGIFNFIEKISPLMPIKNEEKKPAAR